MNNKMVKNDKGITLISLVVTIVILLILSGITISLVLGDNGIINKATEARDKTEQAKNNETEDLAKIEDSMDDLIEESNTVLPYRPDGFTKVKGTNLDNGLVIQDSKGNQYVWVEVPKTEEVYPNAKLNIKDFTDDEYTSIEKDLQDYTTFYGNTGNKNSDEFYTSNSVWVSKEDYYTLKKEMLKSIYQNGGFYIGRYELGIDEGPRYYTGAYPYSSEHELTQTPVIHKNAYPYTWIDCRQSEQLAKKLNPDNTKYNSDLLFGLQWNLTLRYFMSKGIEKSSLTTSNYTTGNFINNHYNITNELVHYSEDAGKTWNNAPYNKTTDKSVILTTGADESFSLFNIYDLAGNLCEFTLEYSGSEATPCIARGGYYKDTSNYFSNARSLYYPIYSYDDCCGRTCLYKK